MSLLEPFNMPAVVGGPTTRTANPSRRPRARVSPRAAERGGFESGRVGSRHHSLESFGLWRRLRWQTYDVFDRGTITSERRPASHALAILLSACPSWGEASFFRVWAGCSCSGCTCPAGVVYGISALILLNVGFGALPQCPDRGCVAADLAPHACLAAPPSGIHDGRGQGWRPRRPASSDVLLLVRGQSSTVNL